MSLSDNATQILSLAITSGTTIVIAYIKLRKPDEKDEGSAK